MNLTVNDAVVWGVIGLVAGTLAGAVIQQKKEGFGHVTNLIFGLIGAFVGGVLFDQLGVHLALGELRINLDRVVAAFVGALIVVFAAKIIEGRRKQSKSGD